MKRRRSTFSENSKPELDISSLIDVSFLLLIFFLVTATLDPREKDLGLDISGNPEGTNFSDIEPFVVKLTLEGEVFINGVFIEGGDSRQMPSLKQALVDYKRITKEAGQIPIIQLDAANGSKHQRFVDVLNSIAAARIKHVHFVM